MTYDELYNIACGIHFTFKNSADKVTLKVTHTKAKREAMYPLFPLSKYCNIDKESFVVACLYINISMMPSSIPSMFEALDRIEMTDISNFRDSVKNYSIYLTKDIQYLKERHLSLTQDIMLSEYFTGKIRFYTLWFWIEASGIDPSSITSRVHSVRIKYIRTMFLFVKFNDKSKEKIKTLLKESIFN